MKRKKMIELRGTRSQSEIAQILGISQQYYSLIESGKRGIHPKYFKKMEIIFDSKMEVVAPDIFFTKKTT